MRNKGLDNDIRDMIFYRSLPNDIILKMTAHIRLKRELARIGLKNNATKTKICLPHPVIGSNWESAY